MMPNKVICKYFIKGLCRYGNRCKNIHPDIVNQPINSKNVRVCRYFLADNCTKNKDCQYFHGYCNRLELVKKIINHKNNINNLINMDESKYISSDDTTFYVRFSNDDTFHDETIANDYKIGKLKYSSEKVICAIENM